MAKFLPFVVDKSTPEYIFQSLITRSKGVNSLLVSSIFNLILSFGISKIRQEAKDLPDDLPLSKVYEELIIRHTSYQISNDLYQKFQSIAEYIESYHKQELNDELKEYDIEDIMIFLMVMYLQSKEDQYISISLQPMGNGDYEKITTELSKFGLFSNDGEERMFQSKEDLRSYIIYYGLLNPGQDTRPIKALLRPLQPKSSDGPQAGPAKPEESIP